LWGGAVSPYNTAMKRTTRLVWIGSCLALSLALVPASPAGDQAARLQAFLAERAPAVLAEYGALLSIPNVSSDEADIRRNAEAVAAMFRRRGVAVRLLEGEGKSAGCPPLVYGELPGPRRGGAAKTVIFYAHYDGQPVDPSKWAGDPWTPLIRDARLEDGGKAVDVARSGALGGAGTALVKSGDGRDYRIYARSAADDKAPIMALAAALDFLKAESIPLGIGVKFLFEGEEEAGSPHLAALLAAHKDLLRADGLFICDGPVDQSGRMQITYGARGTLGLEITVYGPNHPLHSGHYGNWAPNPVALLANLLASLRDDDGRVLVPGFYDAVRPLSGADRKAIGELPNIDDRLRREYGLAWSEAGNARLAERILMPALNFRGLAAGAVGLGDAVNAIPATARASIDFRLVPDQEPDAIKRLVEAHIAARGFHILRQDPTVEDRLAFARLVKLEWEDGYPPYRLPLDDPFGAAVAEALAKALPEPPLRLPALGGSVPMKMFADALGVPVLGLPIVNYDNNQHGPNENLRLKNLWDGIAVFAALLSGFN
jgi:acetylornithine deacetylase/succinyl-diaminopimelate desuccinylase-like protein